MKFQVNTNKIWIPLLIIVLLLGNNPTGGQNINAYVGTISDDEIRQGDTLSFSGSVYNLSNRSISINVMNATFIELLGQSSVRDPRRFNFINLYDPKEVIEERGIFSDNFEAKIDLNPGRYNVSVSFGVSNASSSTESWIYRYALANQTVEIFGTSQSVNIARGIGYFLLAITGLIILYWIYTKFR